MICKPPFSVSTAELFGRIDKRRITAHLDMQGCAARCTPGIFAALRGDVQCLRRARRGAPRKIGSIRGALLDGGALGAVMTGTGSAVFGVFDDRAAAAAAYESLSQSYRECFLVRAADVLTL